MADTQQGRWQSTVIIKNLRAYIIQLFFVALAILGLAYFITFICKAAEYPILPLKSPVSTKTGHIALKHPTLALAHPVATAGVLQHFSQSEIDEMTENTFHPTILRGLIGCESERVNVVRMDSNGQLSYGILQFQSSTWNEFSRRSKIGGSPTNPTSAIAVADWAISNGFLGRWTCAKILGL